VNFSSNLTLEDENCFNVEGGGVSGPLGIII